jgi:hypothetical protein
MRIRIGGFLKKLLLFLCSLCLFTAMIQAGTVSVTYAGTATGQFNCFPDQGPGCETQTNTPFSLTLDGPVQSFQFQSNNFQLPPPITGGHLTWGNIDQALFPADPNSPDYNQTAFAVLTDTRDGSLFLYQGNPLYAILSFTAPGAVGYNYDHNLSVSNVTAVSHPEPTGIQGLVLELESGEVIFDSLTGDDMTATVTADASAPEPRQAGVVAAGIILLACGRLVRRRRS